MVFLYPYEPSKVLPVVFGAIVLILVLIILYRSFRHRWFHFSLVIIWASLVWISGFVMREISVFNPSNVGFFVAQYVLIFCGPPMFAASEYFILGRLLAYLPYHTPFHPGRTIEVFGLLSAAVEALATSGAASAANPNLSEAGRISAYARVKASLILQEFVELFFFLLVAVVEYRSRKAGHFPRNVRIMCRVLYVTSTMMMVRCIVRTVEGFQATSCVGYCGSVELYEWYLWVFEVANITVFIAALAVWHPSKYLSSDNKRYLDPTDGITERVGPGFTAAQNRSTISTIIDPLNLVGMATGKSMVDKFWEQDNPIAEDSFAARHEGQKGSKLGKVLPNPF